VKISEHLPRQARDKYRYKCKENTRLKTRETVSPRSVDLEGGEHFDLVSDESFTAAPGPMTAADIYNGETYVANRTTPGWSTASFNGSGWANVSLGVSAEKTRTASFRSIVFIRFVVLVVPSLFWEIIVWLFGNLVHLTRRCCVLSGKPPHNMSNPKHPWPSTIVASRTALPYIKITGEAKALDFWPVAGQANVWVFDFGVNRAGVTRLSVPGSVATKLGAETRPSLFRCPSYVSVCPEPVLANPLVFEVETQKPPDVFCRFGCDVEAAGSRGAALRQAMRHQPLPCNRCEEKKDLFFLIGTTTLATKRICTKPVLANHLVFVPSMMWQDIVSDMETNQNRVVSGANEFTEYHSEPTLNAADGSGTIDFTPQFGAAEHT
jgi:hypothetical protein